MKVKFTTYSENQSDGGVIVRLFSSGEKAEDYAKDNEERNCDDIEAHEIEVDDEGNFVGKYLHGKLVKPNVIR